MFVFPHIFQIWLSGTTSASTLQKMPDCSCGIECVFFGIRPIQIFGRNQQTGVAPIIFEITNLLENLYNIRMCRHWENFSFQSQNIFLNRLIQNQMYIWQGSTILLKISIAHVLDELKFGSRIRNDLLKPRLCNCL